MISWIGLWFGSHAKNSEEMEQKDGEKVSMESSVSNGKVEEGTGRWCSVNRLFLCYLLHTGYVGCVIDLLLIELYVTLTTLVMLTCYMRTKIWIVIFAADIL